jgi:hypothetical protein
LIFNKTENEMIGVDMTFLIPHIIEPRYHHI